MYNWFQIRWLLYCCLTQLINCRYSGMKEEFIPHLIRTACKKYLVVMIALICVIYPVYIITLLYDEIILCVIVYKLSLLLFCFCFNIKNCFKLVWWNIFGFFKALLEFYYINVLFYENSIFALNYTNI